MALRDINRPAIRGINNGGYDDDDNDDDDDYYYYDDDDDGDYKKVQDSKKELIDQNVLDKNSVKEFDNIINKWKQTKDKDILYINDKNKANTRKLDIYDIFYSYLKKDISYKDIKGITNNIKEAVKLYKKDGSKYSDKNKSIINNSNKTIKGKTIRVNYIINRQ